MSANEVVIDVSDLSKCYDIYSKSTHRLWQSFFPKWKGSQQFWALQDVDLKVHKGETVGIVGRNGSGKSTLLQIITGVLTATSGNCRTEGRISALLELGAGFNPMFTGMENARLNASIMGLSREEFHQKLPDIVEFCGLGDFLHRPVKTYSSGMFVRLAFAVAINMDPDILIIDEALAVGDVRFQRKCFRRLDELKEKGVSILFVTHSTHSVLQYCDRAIMLDAGQLVITGKPKEVVQTYLEKMFASEVEHLETVDLDKFQYAVEFDPNADNCVLHPSYNKNEHRWGDGRAKICQYALSCNGQASNGIVNSEDRLKIKVWVLFEKDMDDLIYGITVKTSDGKEVFGSNTRLVGEVPTKQKSGQLLNIEYSLTVNLLGGDYFVSLGVAQDDVDRDAIAVDRRYDLVHLHVNATEKATGFAALNGEIQFLPED